MGDLTNALKGDKLVLKKNLKCVAMAGGSRPSPLFPAQPSVVTLPKGTTLTAAVNGLWQRSSVPNMWIQHEFEEGIVFYPDRPDNYGVDDPRSLGNHLVTSRNRKGEEIFRSKVKHNKGGWNRAAPDAVAAAYVIADKDGNRFEYFPEDYRSGKEVREERMAAERADYEAFLAYIEKHPKATAFDLHNRRWWHHFHYTWAEYKTVGDVRVGSRRQTVEEYIAFWKSINSNTSTFEPAGVYKEAKKFPDLGRAKQRVLFVCGYYNQFGDMGMLNNQFPAPTWADNWFIWSATKDGEIIEPVLNIAEYVANTQKYADLSKAFGVEAKEVFKKIEKADEPHEGVVVIGKFDGGDYYNDPCFVATHGHQHDGEYIGEGAGYEFSPEEKKAIKAIDLKMKKIGKVKAAFATKTVADAVMIKLAYTGGLGVKVIDMTKLEEHVG